MTYYELLKKDKCKLTYDEREQLKRCQNIPSSVRQTMEAKMTELGQEVIKLEKDYDEIFDFLNGLYVPFTNDEELPE